MHHCLVDCVRQNDRLLKVKAGLKGEPEFLDACPPLEKEDRVAEALRSLSAEQRTVVELKVMENRSFKEISQALEKNEVGLRKVFERARKKMKSFMSEVE